MAAKHADSATDALKPLVGQLSVAELQVLVEHASDGIFIADVNGLYTFVNESGCRMLGCSRAEVIGKTIFDLIPNEDVERLLASKSELLQGATPRSGVAAALQGRILVACGGERQDSC